MRLKSELILGAVVITLLLICIFVLSSCSTTSQVHRMAKRNKCPLYAGAYAKWYHHNLTRK